MTVLAFVFYLLGALIVAVTILPIWQTSRWWVRLCDFPRYQVTLLALTVLVLMPLTLGPLTAAELGFVHRRCARGPVASFVDMALFARRSAGGAKQQRGAQCARSLRPSDDERVSGLSRRRRLAADHQRR